MSDFPSAQAVSLAAFVDWQDDTIVSKTIAKTPKGTMTLFAFDAGQELSEHSAPFDAFVQVLDGRAEIIVDGVGIETATGQMVKMPADIPHAVKARERFKMLLVMLRG